MAISGIRCSQLDGRKETLDAGYRRTTFRTQLEPNPAHEGHNQLCPLFMDRVEQAVESEDRNKGLMEQFTADTDVHERLGSSEVTGRGCILRCDWPAGRTDEANTICLD